MAKVILSAFADEYSKEIDVQLQVLRENGIPYLEPRFINDKNIADLSESEAIIMKEKLGDIKVYSIGSPLGKINLADDFENHMDVAKRVFTTANILECQNVRMFSFYLHPGKIVEECRGEVIEKLGKMNEIAKEYGVTLCHENESGIYGEAPENCLDLLKAFHGDMKCVFDMGNFVLRGYKPYPDAYELLKDYIQYFHIKDALPEGAVVPPGCGKGDIAKLLRSHLQKTGVDVVATLEPHLQTFDGLNTLTKRHFQNPYQYETKEAAFLDAVRKMQTLLEGEV